MNHVRQQNKAVTTIKERETRKTEIERNTHKPLMSMSGGFFFFFGCQRPICGGGRKVEESERQIQRHRQRQREWEGETKRERERERQRYTLFLGLEIERSDLCEDTRAV